MTRKRKPLKDGVASEFVFGDRDADMADMPAPTPSPASESEESETMPTASSKPGSDIMARLAVPEKEATVRLTVDLAKSLHTKLSVAAAKTGRSKADIVRYLIEEALGD